MTANAVLPTTTAPPAMARSSSPPLDGSRGRIARALLHKNWIVKKRHPFATVSELLNPLLCILLFAFLKTLDPDLDIPGGWATTSANKTMGTANTTGSHWNLFAESNLLRDFNSTLAGAGLSRGALANAGNATPAELLNATLPLLTSGSSPLSLLSLVTQLRVPRFYFTETTMPGLMMNMALQSLSEANRLNELSQRDLLLCIAKFALLGYTSLDPTSLYYVPAECQGKVVPYKLAIAPDSLYTRKYVTAILDDWYPRLPLIEPVLGISPLTTPSFADSRIVFADERALESYLSAEAYGLDLSHPKIYAAIAFQQFPQSTSAIGDAHGHDLAFSIRMNSTFTATSAPNSVPRTISRRFIVDKYLRSVKAQNTMVYATRGFLTLQTAVMRVINCLPPWDAAQERVRDSATCQLTMSTLNDTRAETDNRLLKQLEDDLIIGTLLRLLSGMGDAVAEVLDDPTLLLGGQATGSSNSSNNTAAVIAKALQTLTSPELAVANIPTASKRALLRVLRQAPQPFHGASVFMSPTEAFHYAGFYDKVRVVFPVLFILSYLYGVSRVIVALLMEKETRSREFMKIVGIHDEQIIGTWLVTYGGLFFVASLLQTLGATILLFTQSSGVLLFVFFLTFALSSFGFGVLVSTLFSRARAGSFVGMGLFFLMFFVSFSFTESSTEAARTLSCVLSPVALSQGVAIVAQLESIGVGLTVANAHDSIGGFRFMAAVYMQLLDFFLYMALAWYVEKVMPREYGVTERWYFLFSPAYWRRGRRPRHHVSGEESVAVPLAMPSDSREEPVPMELKQQEQDDRAIVISRLRKVFTVPGGTKVAVHGLNLSLYEGQVTCLLGHNGAGKTTLMAMLTGMTPPTSGDARIRGVSILDGGMETIRQSLGYCPQFSVVYPELTVAEHLQFYARVKRDHSVPHGGADSVDRMIRDVGLIEKRDVQAHALSGGMKRKLSLAIAFLGNNKVVFLDEPTSGMDPYSRRSTWELIQRHTQGRIVILTTHFMDEADLLGDRIAILADGELQCVGSSLFLKQRYGVGYRLSFVVHSSATTTSTSNEQRFTQLVQRHVAEATLATDVGTELTFQLPFEASAKFPALFDAIDACKHDWGITSYAISVTTLEEIFLKVAEFPHGHSPNGESSHVAMPSSSIAMERKMQSMVRDDPTSPREADTSVRMREPHGRIVWFLIQVRALLLKRFQSARRDRGMLFYSTLLPIVILLAGLSALRLSLLIKNDPSVQLTTVGQYALGAQTPLPVACVHAGGGGGGSSGSNDDWCEATLSLFPDAVPSLVQIEPIVYNGTVSPTVFNLSYTSPVIQPNDTTGYSLRYAQLAFERGYARDSESMAPFSPQQPPILGQYGGLVLQATADARVLAYNIMVNSSSIHGAPTYKAMADQAIHNLLLANGSRPSPPFKRIRVATHPFPLSFKSRSIFGSLLSLPAVIFVLIAFTFIPAAMMPFLVKEKHDGANARHQQLLAGVSLPAYWLANLLFDLVLYLVPMVVAVLLLRFYNVSSSLSGSNADAETCTACTRDVPQAVVALFTLFGTAIAPWTYLMSHVMRDPGACLLYTVMLNFLFGLVLLLTSYSLDSLDSTREANQVLVYLWRCSPLFSLANGLLRVIIADLEALFGFNSEPLSAFSTDIAGYEMAYLAVQGPVFFILALLVDMVKTGELTFCGRDVRVLMAARWWKGQKRQDAVVEATPLVEDEDVCAERHRVLNRSAEDVDVVRVAQLSKTYANGKQALSNLTFGLARGDCFGFLGINGAGKTTTLKILTGDLEPTCGSASLNGFDILRERARVRQSVGYCPQFDALLELLTVREHLELYGRLKGFSGHDLEGIVRRQLEQFQLQAFEHKLAGSLSGGNKRKLSVALAMLGEPALLFLDEPSTGMDPVARRFLWDIVLRVSVQSRTSTVVLTTHAMEECEALCNKAGIMVGGRLQCFGSIPHLKARFGDGFLLECKLETATSAMVEGLVQDLTSRGLVQDRQVASTSLATVCAALGRPERELWIRPDGVAAARPAGSALCEPLQRTTSGPVDAHALGAWWILEDRVASLAGFLQTHFGAFGSVVLVERQRDFCRFKLTPSAASSHAPVATEPLDSGKPFALARMFRLIEDARRTLSIKEYAIAQTSLEQIFNGFAREQDDDQA